MPNILNNKVYVTGGWFDQSRINSKIEVLKNLGYYVTHNWNNIEVCDEKTPKILADLELEYIKKADLLIVDMTDHDYSYRGIWTEIGIALGSGTEIWIISRKPASTNIFFHSSNITHFHSWNQVFSELKQS